MAGKYDYVLGLRCGGLMEDPDWHMEMVTTVQANNLKEAKNEWANKTGESKQTTWDPINQTVWGWNIMVISTTDPNVPSSEFFQRKSEEC